MGRISQERDKRMRLPFKRETAGKSSSLALDSTARVP